MSTKKKHEEAPEPEANPVAATLRVIANIVENQPLSAEVLRQKADELEK